MTIALYRVAACMLFCLSLSSCRDNPGPIAQELPAAPAAASTAASSASNAVTSPENEAFLKDIILRSGGRCVDIVNLRSLGDLTNKAEVVCTEEANGLSRASYIVDLGAEQAQKYRSTAQP